MPPPRPAAPDGTSIDRPDALPDGLRLRRAGAGDAATVAAFAARAFRETYAADTPASELERYVASHLTAEAFARDLADSAVSITLAESPEGAIAGYVQCRTGARPRADAQLDPALLPPSAATVEIARLYVDPPWHGRGVARALLRTAAADAVRAGAVAWLAVYRQNARAVAFYRKQGLRVAGVQGFDMGADLQEDWVMVAGGGETARDGRAR